MGTRYKISDLEINNLCINDNYIDRFVAQDTKINTFYGVIDFEDMLSVTITNHCVITMFFKHNKMVVKFNISEESLMMLFQILEDLNNIRHWPAKNYHKLLEDLKVDLDDKWRDPLINVLPEDGAVGSGISLEWFGKYNKKVTFYIDTDNMKTIFCIRCFHRIPENDIVNDMITVMSLDSTNDMTIRECLISSYEYALQFVKWVLNDDAITWIAGDKNEPG